MVTVITQLSLKPGKLAVFLEAWEELVIEYRKESDCISSNVLQDLNNVNVVFMISQYNNREAYQIHLDSDAYQKAYTYSRGWLTKEPSIFICSTVI